MWQRARTAFVLLLIFLVAVAVGGTWYWGACLIVLSLAGWEWARLFGQRGLTGSLGGVLGLIWVMLLNVQWPNLQLLRPGISAILIIAMVQMVIRAGKGFPEPATSFSVKLAGGLYLGWMGMHLPLLRMLSGGLAWTCVTLGAVVVADTTAYFVGRRIGKHKIAPRISPGKSWEGYLSGMLGAAVTGGILGAMLAGGRQSAAHGLIIGVLCGSICIFGDLGISAFKRQMDVKDSSGLLPGHGGFLDRLDTVLVGGVLGFYYASWFIVG